MIKFKTTSAEMTEHFGEALGRRLAAGDVIALDGDLGAGKTCLTRGLAAGLGATSFVSSFPVPCRPDAQSAGRDSPSPGHTRRRNRSCFWL